jgi:hypothetical protein
MFLLLKLPGIFLIFEILIKMNTGFYKEGSTVMSQK